jgi:hypothetical protein
MVAILALAASVLVGCNATPKPLIGIGGTPDRPQIILRLCNSVATLVAVHQRSSEAKSTDPGAILWLIANERDTRAILSIEMFSLPEDWRSVTNTGGRLSNDAHYSLNVQARDTPPMTIDFDRSDLQNLQNDQIWTMRDRTPTGVAISTSEFEHRAAKSCAG